MLNTPQNRSIIYMIACAVLWSTAGLFIKLLPWNPVVIAATRSLVAAGVYYLYMRHQKIPFVISRHSLLCAFFLSGNFLLFVGANKLTTAANVIVLQFSAPTFVLVLSALIFKQKFRKGDLAGVAATTLGIALFFFDELDGGYLLGNLLSILAGLFFASMFLATSRADERTRSSGILQGHLLTIAIGVPFFLLFPPELSRFTVPAILALGVFQMAIPYILYSLAVRHISALACVLISAAEPLLNPVWVFLYNGELPGFYALIGGLIVIVSVIGWSIWSNKAAAMAAAGDNAIAAGSGTDQAADMASADAEAAPEAGPSDQPFPHE